MRSKSEEVARSEQENDEEKKGKEEKLQNPNFSVDKVLLKESQMVIKEHMPYNFVYSENVGLYSRMDSDRKAINIFQNYQTLVSSKDEEHVKRAVSLIKGILLEGKNQKFFISFNGGKDATIVLFLTYFACQELAMTDQLHCLYFEEVDPFIQMEEFMASISQMLNLNITRLESKKYQKQLTNFNKIHPIEWIVMGSRKDDPGCGKLQEISESDVHKGYPEFKRICPIIDWSYERVWKFIKDYHIPYCKLYDEGYTSVGNKKNTKKNHYLYDEQTKTYKQAENANSEIQRICRGK